MHFSRISEFDAGMENIEKGKSREIQAENHIESFRFAVKPGLMN